MQDFFTVWMIRTHYWRLFAVGRHQTNLCAVYDYLNTQ